MYLHSNYPTPGTKVCPRAYPGYALGQMKRGSLLQDARPGPAKPAQYHAKSRPAAVIAPISGHLIWVAGRIHQLHDIDSLSPVRIRGSIGVFPVYVATNVCRDCM
jgi:hypothetical protein